MYSKLNLLDIISFVFSNRIKVNSTNYIYARTKILENYRSYKLKIL